MSSTTDESGCSGNANEQEREQEQLQQEANVSPAATSQVHRQPVEPSRRRVPRQQLATFTDSQSRRRRRVPRQQLDRFNSGRVHRRVRFGGRGECFQAESTLLSLRI
ncbi:hypothetical protein AAFF_G00075740 [Aldrovandia affinis]|uniref:Uncharacterized protein n=1 Tax=Aldrovandia affinis TaxID=143900 RepID=A0AAD7RY55_9TELE|nr:hypothetical protein AAFF_G00075740 [Aldrovandia affinis]